MYQLFYSNRLHHVERVSTHINSFDIFPKQLLHLLPLYRRMNDYPLLDLSSLRIRNVPVGRGGDAVFVAKLERVNDPQDFGEVAACRGGIGESETDLFLWVDYASHIGQRRGSQQQEQYREQYIDDRTY